MPSKRLCGLTAQPFNQRLVTLRIDGAWRSLVSALVWGTRGPEFKSRRPDQRKAPPERGFSWF